MQIEKQMVFIFISVVCLLSPSFVISSCFFYVATHSLIDCYSRRTEGKVKRKMKLYFIQKSQKSVRSYHGVLGACPVVISDKVYSITPRNEDELIGIHKWIQSMRNKLDVWREPSFSGNSIDIRVSSTDVNDVEKALKTFGWRNKIMVHNLEKIIEEEGISNNNFGFSGQYNYDAYNRHDQIKNELYRLAKVYPNVETFSVGKSYEGRDMIGVKVTDGSGRRKQAIWIDGGIHAREWISPATVMFTLKQLLEPSEEIIRQKVSMVLSNYDFYILPVFNVDGYEYTHTNNRMWRKTRSRGRFCAGADPNRNWDFDFGGVGTSSDECSDIYHGRNAFSEVEVNNVKSYVSNLQKTVGIKTYWTLHSYGQFVLFPWGGRRYPTKDDYDLKRVGEVFKDSARRRYGTNFIVGQPSVVLYSSTGGTMDYIYGTLRVKYVYCPELRPTQRDRYGFVLPARYIKPAGLEFVDGFFDAVQAM